MLNTLPIVFVLAGLVFYVVLGGADFGAGLWQLLAGRGAPAQRIRELDEVVDIAIQGLSQTAGFPDVRLRLIKVTVQREQDRANRDGAWHRTSGPDSAHLGERRDVQLPGLIPTAGNDVHHHQAMTGQRREGGNAQLAGQSQASLRFALGIRITAHRDGAAGEEIQGSLKKERVTGLLGRVSGKRGLFAGGGLFAIKGRYRRRSQAALRLSPWRIQLSGELEQLLGGIRRSGVVPPPETEDESDVHEVGKAVGGPVPIKQLDTLRDVLLCFVDPAAIPFCKGQLSVKARHDVVVTLFALQLKRLPPQRRPPIALADADLGLTKLLEDGREQLRPVAGPD